GIVFVELLAPPLTDGAANAVRRPVYTRAWTGDPDSATYLHHGTDPGRYIPLDAIRLRRINGKLRAEVDGQPIWPVHHATRSFSPPWDRLARVLLATAPVELPWDYHRMLQSLTRLPSCFNVPRISVSGGIILSPALWRLSTDQLWDRSAPMPAKLRALIRLRSQNALPRWIELMPVDDKPAVPCDLESTLAIRAIERYATGRAQLELREMLPAPDQLLVVDRAHNPGDRLVSQLQMRFPSDESVTAVAERIAPDIRASFGLPDQRLDDASVAARCRGPPATCDHQLAEIRTN
ncbi:MAG TPA: lantibiotic dehydratase, partial [Nitrolancea sp.]|nr:lantibiotic dehydratase [Nitrolancea sp.]